MKTLANWGKSSRKIMRMNSTFSTQVFHDHSGACSLDIESDTQWIQGCVCFPGASDADRWSTKVLGTLSVRSINDSLEHYDANQWSMIWSWTHKEIARLATAVINGRVFVAIEIIDWPSPPIHCDSNATNATNESFVDWLFSLSALNEDLVCAFLQCLLVFLFCILFSLAQCAHSQSN